MSKTILAALCQTPAVTDKAGGLAAAGEYIDRAAAVGAGLVVLPEMFCCPYNNAAFPPNAEPAGGEVWQFLSDAAKKNNIVLAGGSFPEIEDGKIYNTCFVFNEKGEQIGRHRKMHLFDIDIPGGQKFQESDTLAAGRDLCVVDTQWGKIGVMICFDVRFPELARLLALEGAGAIIVPAAFNMTTGPLHWELLMRARAVDNFTYILACAPARDESAGYVSYAHSMVVSPWGKTLARLDASPDILYQELDFELVTAGQAQIPVLSARREDLYEITVKK
ncbi:MAG: carbon-nitrogen hydrolase family protein [Oscillospiraceae bacterium]|nr:carbon-nitrogen hydrolase family protein [Oscillospiraceae bacterium]